MVDKSKWKHCYYKELEKRRSGSPYWSHQKESSECTSAICTDLEEGITMEQIWRKDYISKRKIKGE